MNQQFLNRVAGFDQDTIAAVPLNPAQVRDIIQLYTTHPTLRAGRDAFLNMILRCPPKVTLKSMSVELSDELTMLLRYRWKAWAENLYDWLRMFGVCPFYLKRVPNSVHKYPVVPKLDSGFISTYLDTKGEQHFKWSVSSTNTFNQNVNVERKDILWWYDDQLALPSKDGVIRSSVSTLAEDWRTRQLLVDSMKVAQYQAARPQHVFEYNPPRSQQIDDNFTTLSSFGDDIAGIVLEQTEQLRKKQIRIRTDDLKRAQIESIKRNRSGTSFRQPQYMQGRQQQQQLSNNGFLDRSICLPPDFKYQSAVSPKVIVDIEKITRRLDEKAALITDFPLEMVQASSGMKAANLQGNLRFWNERIKYWLDHYERAYRHVLLIVYGPVIQEGLDQHVLQEDRKRRRFKTRYRLPDLMRLHASTELMVEFPCTPISNFTTLSQLYTTGLMKKETLAKHAFELYGLPQSEIYLSADTRKQTPKEPQEKEDEDPLAKKPKLKDTKDDVSL